jgi:hypothetical protein
LMLTLAFFFVLMFIPTISFFDWVNIS